MKKGLSGYATMISPVGQMKERDTFTCGHCQNIRHVVPGGRHFLYPDAQGQLHEWEYTRCGQCSELICEKCAGKGCLPFERKLEMYERAKALYAAARDNK